MITQQILSSLESDFKINLNNLLITKIIFGLRLTAVELSDGSVGVASTLDNNNSIPDKINRDFGEFSPSKFSGKSVKELFKFDKNSSLIDTAKIAVLNAVSSNFMHTGKYTVLNDVDPYDLIEVRSDQKITIVGAFRTYIEKISKTDAQLRVLELNENSLAGDFHKYYVPAEKYHEVIPDSDIVIITGLTLVNNTLDGLLKSVKPGTKVIVTGPSANIIPDILFNNKVDIIGATEIIDKKLLFTLVAEASAGYHLFKYCARKICIVNE